MGEQYPRPNFRRNEWQSLNGQWEFMFDDSKVGEKEQWYLNFPKEHVTIMVPFTYETKMSGICEEAFHNTIWYHRELEINKTEKSKILHFEGVDYEAKVWVNGQCAGSHEGCYSSFSFDITDYLLEGKNHITVLVTDSMSLSIPRGKQRWKEANFGCWYVQTTGIWKSVWLEEVAKTHIHNIKITPDIDHGTVAIEGKIKGELPNNLKLICEVYFNESLLCKQIQYVAHENTNVTIDVVKKEEPWTLKLWSPSQPNLYDLILKLETEEEEFDTVSSYFGMRKISIAGNKILLNNEPLYQRLILDQGYWEESHLTPPSDEAIIEDIKLILAAGYNGVRKHQKVEDKRFLYWCDKMGLLVWSEIGATYIYNDDAVEAFTKEWMKVVEQNYNHPSIITWTVFNESWGVEQIYSNKKQQDFTRSMYYLTKAYDSMRPVIVNDGWEHTISDIITLHDYEELGKILYDRYQEKDKILQNEILFNNSKYAFANGYFYTGQPILISEYGGIAFSSESGWGYGNQVKTEDEFIKRFRDITNAIKQLDYVVGYCYTQVTDVQQEINGLYTSRREAKIDITKIKEINEGEVH